MYSNFYNEKNELFSIIAASLAFHVAIVAALLTAVWLRPAKESPPPIPFFEMVNLAPPPPPAPAPKKQAEPAPKPEPVAEPVPDPIPEPKPELKPEPKPEPTPTPKKPDLKPEPKPEPKPAAESKPAATEPTPAAAAMDMPMDLPSDIKSRDMDMPAIRTVGSVDMDSQLKAYISRLVMLIYQNFNPPSGTEISSGTKSSVQFKIARNGEISDVTLRSSSGNSIWDRLAVRAVQITKPPPLPPSYTAEELPLIFDFREK